MNDEELRKRFDRLDQGQCIIIWFVFVLAGVIVILNVFFSQH